MSVKKCKYGHLRTPDNVYLSNGGCKECNRLRSIKKNAEEPEKQAKYKADWAARNPEKVKAAQVKFFSKPENVAKNKERLKEYCKNNPDKRKKAQLKYRAKNLSEVIERGRRWRRENPAHAMYLVRRRQAAKLLRTPKWLSKEQNEQIKMFYVLAVEFSKQTGVKHHVDHIIPLRGKTVSGLHVPWNLNIISATENMIKHNKFIPGVQIDL